MEKLPNMWCVKPENKEQGVIVGKWFDENWGEKNIPKLYQIQPLLKHYYVYGIRPGDVYYTQPKGKAISFSDFTRLVLNKIIEPTYEIY